MADRHRLRTAFEEVPELYERARPVYPSELFDDLVSLARLEAGARVLEIGCGTGQATVPLAERGFEVLCIELGEQLAARARANLAGFPNVDVVNATFEEWEPGGDLGFDAVVAFTAFHWIDPEARYEKPARLLRPGSSLAIVETQHVLSDGGDPFWVEVQDDYNSVVPSDENRPPPRPEDVGDLRTEVEADGRFGDVEVRRYLWDVTYSGEDYLAVLDTYSVHRTMSAEARAELYRRIRRRIDARADPRVTKTYLATLTLGRKGAG